MKNKKYFLNGLLFCLLILLSACVGDIKLPEQLKPKSSVDTWVESLQGKSSAEQVEIANKVWTDGSALMSLRNRAAYILASRNNEYSSIAQASLENQYKDADYDTKILIENTLLDDLSSATNKDLQGLILKIKPNKERVFPYNLIIYTAAKRKLLKNSEQILEALAQGNFFVSPRILGVSAGGDSPYFPVTDSGCVALLLPRSGVISGFSDDIIAGAKVAQELLASQGLNWELRVVDTQDPMWLHNLRMLPKNCVTVGGPLQSKNYLELEKNQILPTRAFFAFLPSLRVDGVQHEGQNAWRFFSSREDQINAVLDVATTDLGITDFGSFAPDNLYGKHMQNLFDETARGRGLTVTSANYPPNEPKTWTAITQSFLQSEEPEERIEMPIVKSTFEAIFLPDSWRNMDLMVSNIHYNGALNKVILGTSLWEQSLNQRMSFNTKTFALTLFPVAYDAKHNSKYSVDFRKALLDNGHIPSDWSALGFDFMLMASQLGLNELLPSQEINKHLAALSINYVSAPFVWDNQGLLRRKLFINQPSREGRVPYNKAEFIEYRKNGGVLPNREIHGDAIKAADAQEQQALDELDSLIQTIVPATPVPSGVNSAPQSVQTVQPTQAPQVPQVEPKQNVSSSQTVEPLPASIENPVPVTGVANQKTVQETKKSQGVQIIQGTQVSPSKTTYPVQ